MSKKKNGKTFILVGGLLAIYYFFLRGQGGAAGDSLQQTLASSFTGPVSMPVHIVSQPVLRTAAAPGTVAPAVRTMTGRPTISAS